MAKALTIEGMTVLKNEFTERNAQGEFVVKDSLSPKELVRWAVAQRGKSYDPMDWDLTPFQVPGQSVSAELTTDEDGVECITIKHSYRAYHCPYGKEEMTTVIAETALIFFEDLAN